jgi:hypothetical protein
MPKYATATTGDRVSIVAGELSMVGLTFLIALALLETGLFVIGPVLQNWGNTNLANGFYILLRVVTIVGFSFLLVRKHRHEIYGALSLTGLLIFIDQVIFKSLWIVLEMKRDPAAWQGVDTKAALFNSAFSYIVSLPVILLLAFIGSMLALKMRK